MSGKKMPPLTPAEADVIVQKGTEKPGCGAYLYNKAKGTYVCRACGAPIYSSTDKFDSACGWPAFDQAVGEAVAERPDADGRRTEIICANCGGHLGHVFRGEQLTPKNVRHCVNSLSMHFVPEDQQMPQVHSSDLIREKYGLSRPPIAGRAATAVFAGGCFWGLEHIYAHTPGVLAVESGYSGGFAPNPTYRQVCAGHTGHAEAVKVSYDPEQVSYEKLARLFFEAHDPSQADRQGPDVGSQYRSILFYGNEKEREIAEDLVARLRKNGYDVVTEIIPVKPFYPAEEYHQKYLEKHPEQSCGHRLVKRFEIPA